MMHATVIVMTVLGCGDQTMSCDLIVGPKVVWQSHSECEAAVPDALQKLKNAPYPTITAQCEAIQAIGNPAGPKTRAIEQAQFPAETGVDKRDPPVAVKGKKLSVTGLAVHRAKRGYASLQNSAAIAVDGMAHGATVTYYGISDGIQSSFRGTRNVTRRAVGIIQVKLGLEN